MIEVDCSTRLIKKKKTPSCFSVSLKKWFSIGDDFVPQGTFGDVWNRLSRLEGGGQATGIQWAETRDAAECLTMYRTASPPPHTAMKNYSKEVSEPNSKVEKLWSKASEGTKAWNGGRRHTLKVISKWQTQDSNYGPGAPNPGRRQNEMLLQKLCDLVPSCAS